MFCTPDPASHEVIVGSGEPGQPLPGGGGYEARLTWRQALTLGHALIRAALAASPRAKTFEPKQSRW